MSKILVKIDTSTAAGLRQLRDARGLNLDEVAQKAEMDPTWLSRAERGLRPMNADQMARIRQAIETIVTRRE
ncbi:MAG TPA: helix-turn-helix transcriptional regulator, partial [Anaerolineae bacterium]|nr:helix-turn-helix transcriptional regulator [Anaerolineae bacterium]